MKAFEVNRKSWHYKLVNFIDPNIKYDDESDLCSYTRKALLGLLVILALSVIIIVGTGAILYNIGNTIGYIVAGLMLGEFAPFEGPPVVIAMLALFTIFFWSVANFGKFRNHLRSKFKPDNRQEGFVSKAYSSWREKTCSKITFEKSE